MFSCSLFNGVFMNVLILVGLSLLQLLCVFYRAATIICGLSLPLLHYIQGFANLPLVVIAIVLQYLCWSNPGCISLLYQSPWCCHCFAYIYCVQGCGNPMCFHCYAYICMLCSRLWKSTLCCHCCAYIYSTGTVFRAVEIHFVLSLT